VKIKALINVIGTRADGLAMPNLVIFIGLGPPLGCMSLLVAIIFAEGRFYEELPDLLIIGLPFPYLLGVIPATIAWLAVRQIVRWRLRPEWLLVAIVGVVVGFLFIVISTEIVGESLSVQARVLVVYAFTGFFPTVVCWRLSKSLAKHLEIELPDSQRS
jgi:hypothetical protein